MNFVFFFSQKEIKSTEKASDLQAKLDLINNLVLFVI